MPASVPPISVEFAHGKFGRFSDSAMVLPAIPAVEAVTVTVLLLLLLAVTPMRPPPLFWIAAARLLASCVVLTAADPDQKEKFRPVFEPSEPPTKVVPPQAKPLSVLVLAILPELPASLAVTVTALPVALAVTGTL